MELKSGYYITCLDYLALRYPCGTWELFDGKGFVTVENGDKWTTDWEYLGEL